jgi:alanine dehydrogenase
MHIGIPKENGKTNLERRAILLPKEVSKLVEAGHHVFVEKGLGKGVYINDDEYKEAGAVLTASKRDIFNKSIVVKLKPPLPQEFKLLNNNLLFSMFHAQQNPHYVKALGERKAKAIAMELIRNRAGERLVQCTDISGEQGMIQAFHLAEKSPGECNVLVLGYGGVSSGALRVAFSLGANVKIVRKGEYKHIKTLLHHRDIVVNGIQWPEEKRKKKEYLITRDMLSLLNKGAIILDLSVDFPNPIECCRPSPQHKPVYTVDGVRCMSVYGYPRLVPVSSSKRYSSQILPILLKIASTSLDKLPKSIKDAIIDPVLSGGQKA